MKILLISTGTLNDKGPKKIASFLEKHEHRAEIIFYRKTEIKKILIKCKTAGLIIVSANVSTHKQASVLIKSLKKLKKPVAYAGIYPSLYPKECIKETDLVILAKPAETILELANRLENFQRVDNVPNLSFKFSKEEVIKNA
ncbi:MAG: hypothetical protein AABX65_00250 [Nanoarchaeota archaeon]